jgi:hypothetical protein
LSAGPSLEFRRLLEAASGPGIKNGLLFDLPATVRKQPR